MKAVVFDGPFRISLQERPVPKCIEPVAAPTLLKADVG